MTGRKAPGKSAKLTARELEVLQPFIDFSEKGVDEFAKYVVHCGIHIDDIDAASGDVMNAILAHYAKPGGGYDLDAVIHDWFRWPPVVARIKELKRERASGA